MGVQFFDVEINEEQREPRNAGAYQSAVGYSDTQSHMTVAPRNSDLYDY